MNVWRGLVRLWIFTTLIWITIIAITQWNDVHSPYVAPQYFLLSQTMELQELRRTSFDQIEHPNHNVLEFPNAITVFLAKEITPDALNQWARSFNQTHVAARQRVISMRRTEALKVTASVAFVPPILLLVIGVGLRWVARGFRP